MATTTPIPPAVAAFFARRTITPVRVTPAPAAKRAVEPVALPRPSRLLRRGSLLDLLV